MLLRMALFFLNYPVRISQKSCRATVIIGGISFSGGSGKITSALLGALIMGVLKNGLVMAGVSDYWQQVVSGAVLITVVAYDSYQSYKLKHASK